MTDAPAPGPLTPEPLTPELEATIAEIFGLRDREHMQPTIDAFLALLAEHPGQPEVLYEVGGSYDTAGDEETAAGYYEAALAAGLDRRHAAQVPAAVRQHAAAARPATRTPWPCSTGRSPDGPSRRRCARSTPSDCTPRAAATAPSASCSRSSPTPSARPTCSGTRRHCTATRATSSDSTPARARRRRGRRLTPARHPAQVQQLGDQPAASAAPAPAGHLGPRLSCPRVAARDPLADQRLQRRRAWRRGRRRSRNPRTRETSPSPSSAAVGVVELGAPRNIGSRGVLVFG